MQGQTARDLQRNTAPDRYQKQKSIHVSAEPTMGLLYANGKQAVRWR